MFVSNNVNACEFMKGAIESGNSAEKIYLYDNNISFCRACYACFKTGKCVIQDDMSEILEKISKADVLVIATPTYFLTMNGILKTVIDRFLPKWQDLGEGVWPKGEVVSTKATAEAYETGKNL